MAKTELIPRAEWERWLREEENCRPYDGDSDSPKIHGDPKMQGEWWQAPNSWTFRVILKDVEGSTHPSTRDQTRTTIAMLRLRPPKNPI